MTFEKIQSERMYSGRAFNVRRDKLLTPNGETIYLDIVDHVGAVTLIPVDDEGRMWFVRQYRHAAGDELLELPAGTLDPGEDPEHCARREIREEIGMAAGRLSKIGEAFLAPGYSTEFMHFYMATELHPDPLPRDQDEFLTIEAIPVKDVYRWAVTGQIRDAKTLAGLLLARDSLADQLS